MKRQISLAAACAALLVACAAPPSSTPTAQVGEAEVRDGTITRIDPVQIEGEHQLGVGAILGSVAGGVLGYQVGSGTGRTVASVAGSLLGGYAGSKAQNYSQKQPGQYIMVALPGGLTVGVTQPVDPTLRVGDPVRIDGSGSTARVTRR
jgi:outer membrane lipoprotein SlyB